ncbi:hypothetical protein FVE85_5098 [Porphyridium purpureum]|uniref:Uncharacterized protein n=1 Tax=Porphyridium purpureum TaxID=35688 RepID=A0A5J4Z3K2_PORPP|nr:hypothetical protein FVE85_5098 [Porphyridium purpureum]|eukprot:POR6302..scf295_1
MVDLQEATTEEDGGTTPTREQCEKLLAAVQGLAAKREASWLPGSHGEVGAHAQTVEPAQTVPVSFQFEGTTGGPANASVRVHMDRATLWRGEFDGVRISEEIAIFDDQGTDFKALEDVAAGWYASREARAKRLIGWGARLIVIQNGICGN